ncbi:ATP-binding protein [Salinispora tropica]|uniref:ATP-binding region, ATPase domain protein domain protein n=1 Tax=Salinispora tropica (strain ATCC BAA-916 / DSM 44818 / JCM 13857 / NBRC 105044 / CNB-440) TaxID=369723 RepID=A4XB56_SALTO|nr:ATP-binding protein [Salinispora tropica]ABP56155.1 ATP-binding region, ATPase domain protein domain protein [Salinispora tropica CNB-440]
MTNADPDIPRTAAPPQPCLLIATAFDRRQLTQLRHSASACAHAAGLRGQRLNDFVLAVNELTTNAVRHGGGRGSLRMWRQAESLVCEVSDQGDGISSRPLGDHRRPAPETVGGWGLWLVRELSDTMDVTSDRGGTVVRITTILPVPHPPTTSQGRDGFSRRAR